MVSVSEEVSQASCTPARVGQAEKRESRTEVTAGKAVGDTPVMGLIVESPPTA